MALNFKKVFFFFHSQTIEKKKKSFFIPFFVSKILKKLFTKFKYEKKKKTFLKSSDKENLLVNFKIQNSIIP